jgi:hypothetical protein
MLAYTDVVPHEVSKDDESRPSEKEWTMLTRIDRFGETRAGHAAFAAVGGFSHMSRASFRASASS